MANPKIKKILAAVDSKVKQFKEKRSKRANEAEKSLIERGINPAGLTKGQTIRFNKKLTKSDLRGRTTSAVGDLVGEVNKTRNEFSRGVRRGVNVNSNISSSSDSGSSATINQTTKPNSEGKTNETPRQNIRKDLERASLMMKNIKNPQKKY